MEVECFYTNLRALWHDKLPGRSSFSRCDRMERSGLLGKYVGASGFCRLCPSNSRLLKASMFMVQSSHICLLPSQRTSQSAITGLNSMTHTSRLPPTIISSCKLPSGNLDPRMRLFYHFSTVIVQDMKSLSPYLHGDTLVCGKRMFGRGRSKHLICCMHSWQCQQSTWN